MAMAVVAAALSEVALSELPGFVAVWGVVFAALHVLPVVLEQPLVSYVRTRHPSAMATALATCVLAALWATVLSAYVPIVRALWPWNILAVQPAAALATLIAKPQATPHRLLPIAAILLASALVLCAMIADPESRYNARYNNTGVPSTPPSELPQSQTSGHSWAASEQAAGLGSRGEIRERPYEPATIVRRGARAPSCPNTPPSELPQLHPGDPSTTSPIATTGEASCASDMKLARSLSYAWMGSHPPETLVWSWEETVAVVGLLAYAQASGDPAPIAYARQWVQAHKHEALTTTLWADACAPAIVCATLQRLDGPRPLYERITSRVDRYLTTAPRTTAGLISHVGNLGGGWLPRTAWVDSLFMHGAYLLERQRTSPSTQRASQLRDLLHGFCNQLFDGSDNLFRHGLVDLGPWQPQLPVERMYWARGNGWALYVLAAHLADQQATTTPDPALLITFKDMAERLARCQDPATGLWHTDLLSPQAADNPPDTSASALIAAALSIGEDSGLVADNLAIAKTIELAHTGLLTKVNWVGSWPVLTETTAGTHLGFRAYYRGVPRHQSVGHGVGAALMLLCPSQERAKP